MVATIKPIMEPEIVPRTTLTGMNHLKEEDMRYRAMVYTRTRERLTRKQTTEAFCGE